ncbi:TonB-dependent receptor [Tenacibaculum finnmarkense]|nr:TonB-dependent receptor [Tenacibaculum finnmarkense]
MKQFVSLKKRISINIILFWFLCFFTTLSLCGQNNINKKDSLSLAQLLTYLSDKHSVHFTYNPQILSNFTFKKVPFKTLSLKESLHLLKKITPLNIDALGNNYYVLYAKKPQRIFTSDKKTTTALKANLQLDEVLVTGSRNNLRATKDAAIATDIINLNKIASKSSLLEINDFLQKNIPSFNANKQSGADGADHSIPATYRGLGPDQTLVLINGKRRHQASLINLHGTRGRGNSGTDLNAIPVSAIKKIEILKDGASAQYGSDAIAGVINILLKNDSNSLNVQTTLGFNNASKNTNTTNNIDGHIDGFTYKIAINYGTKLFNKGFLNISSDFLSKDQTSRLGTDIRRKYGNAAIKKTSSFFNSEIPIAKNLVFYANGGYHFKNTAAYAFSRKTDSERNVTALYPKGFDPLITAKISDKSFSTGLKLTHNNWNIDVNNTFGINNFHYFIKNTLNATLLEKSPTTFNAGGHLLSQNTTSIDFSKNVPTFFKGINIAFGTEHRLEKYQIFSGEQASYSSYDTQGNLVTPLTLKEKLVTLNTKIRPGASQGFPGYSPKNELQKSRNNLSFYLDSEVDFTKKWMLATAFRYEHYTDFSNAINYKLASRIKLLPTLNLRTSFSTGFRAPSLAQVYYNFSFTNYIGNTPSESVLIANNSSISRTFGVDKLKEEKTKNTSFGIAYTPKYNFIVNVDTYLISIKDRIILSGNFNATTLNLPAQNIQFFANGVHSTTRGLDIKINWFKKFNNSKLSIDLFGNINSMKIDKVAHKNLDKETFFGVRERHFLLASAPKNKFILNFNYQKEKININTNITRFSGVTLIDWKMNNDIYLPKYTVDLQFQYHLFKNIIVQTGATNIFNTYPTIQDKYTDSGGVWDATQMGTSGAFYYSKVQFSF